MARAMLLFLPVGDASVVDVINAVEALDHALIMGDADHGTALFAGDLAKEGHHALAAFGDQGRGRFIGQDHRRRVRESAGEVRV